MDIYPLGHSSFRIKGKGATVVTDPFDSGAVGLKFPKLEAADIITISHDHPDHNASSAVLEKIGTDAKPFIVDGPGEYEIKEVTILGIPSFHDGKSGEERGKNTIYVFTVDGLRLCHLGDLGHKLTDEQVEEIGSVDILFIPVGGHFTIDAKVAAEVVAQIEPTIVIPMHYQRAGLSKDFAEVLAPVGQFLKEMGAEAIVPESKYSTSKDKLPETTTVVVLE